MPEFALALRTTVPTNDKGLMKMESLSPPFKTCTSQKRGGLPINGQRRMSDTLEIPMRSWPARVWRFGELGPLFRVQWCLMALGQWSFGTHVHDASAFALRLRKVLRR
jgi:hypothetical protein